MMKRFEELFLEKKIRAGSGHVLPILSCTIDGIKKQSDRFNKQIASVDNSNYLVASRDELILSPLNLWMGGIGIQDICKKGVVSPAYKVFSLNEEQIAPEFAKYFVKSSKMMRLYLISSTSGASIVRRNLDLDYLKKSEIELPTLDDQKKSAAIFFQVDELINIQNDEVVKIKNLRKALQNELLTKPNSNNPWDVVNLGEIATFRNGLNYSASNSGKGLKVIGVGDFKDYNSPIYSSLSEINPEGVVSEEDYLKEDDFIFVRSNGNRQLIGRSLIIKELGDKQVSFSGFVIRCRLNDKKKIHPDFIKHIFKSDIIRSSISDKGAGTNISNLNQQILSNLKIILPPLHEQEKLITLFQTINMRISSLEKSIKKLEVLKLGLIEKLA